MCMKKRVVIVYTPRFGHLYSSFIAKEINLLGKVYSMVSWKDFDANREKNGWEPEDVLIHFRAAGPGAVRLARRLESEGFFVINSAEVLERTSDKFLSYEWGIREKKLGLPKTFKVKKSEVVEVVRREFGEGGCVVKPINSKSQGAFCYKLDLRGEDLEEKVVSIPGDEVVVQELVPYEVIYRVVVVGGVALAPAVFSDRPKDGDWKVSVCLNPKIVYEKNPDPELLEYAELVARVFELEVGFVDVFGVDGGYVLSEINTACRLNQHERKSGYNISGKIAEYLVSRMG